MAEHEADPLTIANRLMRYRVVELLGEINLKTVDRVIGRLMDLQLASSDPIRLVISSTGGSVGPAMLLHDTISYVLAAPVHGIVLGACHSAATFVLLACDERYAMPHARFLMHSGTFHGISLTANEMSVAKAERLFEEIKKQEREVLDFYSKKLHKSDAAIRAYIERGDSEFDNLMNPQEALECGLITKIIDENLGIFPPP